jgi:hypothetical protein
MSLNNLENKEISVRVRGNESEKAKALFILLYMFVLAVAHKLLPFKAEKNNTTLC